MTRTTKLEFSHNIRPTAESTSHLPKTFLSDNKDESITYASNNHNKNMENAVYMFGTGAQFGNHYTTDEMIEAFCRQRLEVGDVDCDLDFAKRVFRACQFDTHSVMLPKKDLFRRFTRQEYLEHRRKNLVEMAAQAAEKALDMWNGDPSQITHLLWGTMTGGMDSPSIDIRLVSRLGLSMDVERTNIEGMGCLTGFRLLNLAQQIAMGNPKARILVVEGDLRSALGNQLPSKMTKADIVVKTSVLTTEDSLVTL